jgi:hypothetical protein
MLQVDKVYLSGRGERGSSEALRVKEPVPEERKECPRKHHPRKASALSATSSFREGTNVTPI